MIEYLDLVISLTFIIFVFVYTLMIESKVSYKTNQEEQINYRGLIEIKHVLETGIPTRYSETSSFKITIRDENTTYFNLDYPGYTLCETIPYITLSGGKSWVDICI